MALVETTVRNGLGLITLNRPSALNALSLEMIRSISDALLCWQHDSGVDTVLFASSSERAFCAGGDIRFFHEVGTQAPAGGSARLEDFFTEEYTLNHLIHRYPKPTISLMNGIVMGGGMGIAQGTQLRVITERTRMGMPEVTIGLFPDVGGGYFLSRAAGEIGTWLALTGQIVHPLDAIESGLADCAIASSSTDAAIDKLSAAAPGTRIQALQNFAHDRQHAAALDAGLLQQNRAAVAAHFSYDDMATILKSLGADNSAFARHCIELMAQRSPLMLCVTLQQLRRANGHSIAEVLRMERTMIRHCFEQTEVLEGIRARVIDKDNTPRWHHASVEAVTNEEIDQFFEQVWPPHAHPLRMLD